MRVHAKPETAFTFRQNECSRSARICTFEVKGLTFADTATFSGMFAEEQVREYAEKHHYRYYVMTLRSSGFKGRAERVSAMMYH
ncbi:hypothetical protein ABQ333_27080 [Serratia fonticola]|uniref:hypothetical protein n=1 Tax=Serratia fonticola TaxID=47917 RepID=UPI003AAC4AA2